jgi:hypothetical protein
LNNFSVHLWQHSATSQAGYLRKYFKYYSCIKMRCPESLMDIGFWGMCLSTWVF